MDENTITQQEREELESLRQGKKQSDLTNFATEQLGKYGISASFAPFLLGEDMEKTMENVDNFSQHFSTEKTKLLQDFSQQSPTEIKSKSSSKRGIRRL